MRLLSIGLLSILLTGCETVQSTHQYNVVTEKIFNLPFDAVWTAIPPALTQAGITIDNIYKDSGFINTVGIRPKANWFDCGFNILDFGSAPSSIGMTLSLSIRKVETDKTKAVINLAYMRNELVPSGFSDTAINSRDCRSTGILENNLWRNIERNLGL